MKRRKEDASEYDIKGLAVSDQMPRRLLSDQASCCFRPESSSSFGCFRTMRNTSASYTPSIYTWDSVGSLYFNLHLREINEGVNISEYWSTIDTSLENAILAKRDKLLSTFDCRRESSLGFSKRANQFIFR